MRTEKIYKKGLNKLIAWGDGYLHTWHKKYSVGKFKVIHVSDYVNKYKSKKMTEKKILV